MSYKGISKKKSYRAKIYAMTLGKIGKVARWLKV